MMNAIAIAMLLSSIGLVMVLSPKPVFVMSSLNNEGMLKSTKEVVEETLIETKDILAEGVKVVTKPVEKSTSWFQRKPKPEDHIAIAKEKASLAKEAMHEAGVELKAATLEKLNSVTHFAIDKTTDIYHEAENYVGDKTSEAMDASKDVVAASKHKMESNILKIEQKTQDVAKDAYNSAIEILESTKENTYEKFEGTRDSIYDGVGYVKEKLQDVVASVTDEAYDVGVKTKDMASNIVGFSKNKANKGSQSLKEITTNVGENGGEKISEDVKTRAKDVTDSAMNFARQPYDNIKNKADHYYCEQKDQLGENYNSIIDTIQDYYDEVGQGYKSAKDNYDGLTNHHKGRSSRHYYKGVGDGPYKPYYNAAKDEVDNYYNNIKDKSTHLSNNANYKIKNPYDNVRDKLHGYVSDPHNKESREYSSMARRNVYDKAEEYYKNTKFKPKRDLGEVVESMGWRRVDVVTPDHSFSASDNEVVIGNVKYEWHNKGKLPSHETISNHVSNSIKDVAHTMDERVDLAREHTTRNSQNMHNNGIHAKDEVHDDVQTPHDYTSQIEGYPWTNHYRSHYQEYKDNNKDRDDDYISSRRIKNLKARMRNRGRLYKSQLFKPQDYVDLAEKDNLDSSHYNAYQENLEEGRNLRSWKDVFLKRPEGLLLLLTRALHIFTFSTIYGSSFWVTFVSGLVLSKHISRQQFGYVQSRIFPLYLRLLIVGQSLLFILHSVLHPWFIANDVEKWELLNFGLMIASTLINAYVLEPQATKVMFERLKVEKEGRGLENVVSPMDAKLLMGEYKKKLTSINQQFKALHNYSSALNLISLGGLTCHLWHLAHRLVI